MIANHGCVSNRQNVNSWFKKYMQKLKNNMITDNQNSKIVLTWTLQLGNLANHYCFNLSRYWYFYMQDARLYVFGKVYFTLSHLPFLYNLNIKSSVFGTIALLPWNGHSVEVVHVSASLIILCQLIFGFNNCCWRQSNFYAKQCKMTQNRLLWLV